jgi:hypothetical protein
LLVPALGELHDQIGVRFQAERHVQPGRYGRLLAQLGDGRQALHLQFLFDQFDKPHAWIRKRTAAATVALVLVLDGVGAVFGAGPATAATCFGLASPPSLGTARVVGKNTAGCSGRPANVSVYVSLEWQLPSDGGGSRSRRTSAR